MGLASRKGIMVYMLCIHIVCLLLCESKGIRGFRIFRSEQDIFTNLNCTGEVCTQSQCEGYGAECVSDTNCTYCLCLEGKNTFMINECKSDEEIVPESVPDKGFWLQNQNLSKCLKLVENDKIIGTSCTSPTPDMLWIWTNTTERLLMNVKTLECMERQSFDNGKVLMEPCTVTILWQRMTCTKEQYGIKIRWKEVRDPFLHLDNNFDVINKANGNQLWNSNGKNLCGANITYAGCYRFSDGSFMKYLNYSEINLRLRVSAPVFKDNDHDCKVRQNFKFIRDGQKWEITERHFSISIKSIKINTRLVKELQFSTTEHFKAWNGSVLQLFVACGNEEHCVLLKLASSDVFNSPPSPPLTITTTRETSGFDETHYIAIVAAVTLFLLALALGIGCLVYYGRRKRAQVAENIKYDTGVFKCPEAIYEEPDSVYETINETPPSELETSTDAYSYPNTNIIANPALTENGTLKEKGHDVPDNEPGISADAYIYPDTNRDTKPAVTEHEAPREEEHKLPSNQPGKSSDTFIHPGSNSMSNSSLTEHDIPTEKENEVPSNVEPEISSGSYIYPDTNKDTKPAVTNEDETPTEEEHEVPSNLEPEISSGTYVHPDTNTNRNTKPAVNEDETPKDEGHEVLGSLELGTNSDKYIYPDVNRNAKPAVNEYDIPMEEHEEPSKHPGTNSGKYMYPDSNKGTKQDEIPREKIREAASNQAGTTSDTYIHPNSNSIANSGSS